MKRFASIVFVLLVVPLLLLAQPKPASIPFTTNSDGFIVVPVTLGGSVPIHVIFDTGAGLDVLAPSLIEKVHGKPAGQFTGFRMTGERMDIALFIVPELSVGPVMKKDALVGSWDLLDKLHLDGIISLSDFRQQCFTFDFANKELIFETEETMIKRRAAGKSSPLQVDDQRGISLSMFARFLIADQPGLCEIDTGSPTATVNTRYMTPLRIDKDAKDVRKREGRTVAGGMEIRYDTSLPELSLAAAPQISLVPAPVSFSDIVYDCVVGVDFWHDRALTIDIANRQLIVSNAARNAGGEEAGHADRYLTIT
jgi:hypothetical protein